MIDDDTIVAIASGSGVGGVGVVRISGPQAVAIGEALVGRPLDRTVRVAWVTDGGARIDQVIAFAMRRPASFTGEDVVELQGHGGRENLQRLVGAVTARGARIAAPGEFTRRAVANGKLDVQQAEALLDVIHAGSERAWRLAMANLEGRLGERAAAVEARALKLLAELEGWIDFPDEDLSPQSAAWIEAELVALRAACAALAGGFRAGRAVTKGIVVALVGAVNVGKSSLLNALVGTERALVDASPGTTRDWLEVSTIWDGVAVTLVDTAGLRATTDAIERRGIELGEARVAAADVVLVLDDGPGPWNTSDYGGRALPVRSKCDTAPPASVAPSPDSGGSVVAPSGSVLTNAGAVITHRDSGAGSTAASPPTPSHSDSGGPVVSTSARTGAGLDELKRRVLAMAGVAARDGAEDGLVTTARQHGVVTAAGAAFAAALVAWRAQRPPEVVAVELRTGSAALAELRGTEVGDRVLDELFARFCIGK